MIFKESVDYNKNKYMIQLQPNRIRRDKILMRSVGQKIAITPFFIVQLRLTLQNGPREYYGVIDCADSIIVREGVAALWRGLPFDIMQSYIFKQTSYMVHGGGLTKKIVTALFFMNLQYCRVMIKIDNQLTYKQLFKSLIESYATKNGRYALFGSLLVYGSHIFFYKIKNYFSNARGHHLRNNFLLKILDILMAAIIVFPVTNIGYFMISNRFQTSNSSLMQNFHFAESSVATFFILTQTCIKYFFSYVI